MSVRGVFSRMVKKKSHIEFLDELKARNTKITVLGIYEGGKYKIAVKCNKCCFEWAPDAASLLAGHGCPKCGGTMQKTHADFVKDLASLRDDVVIIGRYVKALEKAKFRFMKCGHEWDVTPAHILSGRGCPVCARSRRGAIQCLTMSKFLESLHKIDPNLVVREGCVYKNNRTPMPLRCIACGYEYKISAHEVLGSRGCPNCHRANTSFFEQFIYHSFACILGKSKVVSREKIAIGFELDIYIPELKAAVEPGSWYWHKKLTARDMEKHLLCEERGITLITIYDHYDDPIAPFENCIVTPCDLTARRNMDRLIEITRTLLSRFGLDVNLDPNDWEKIKREAQLDSKRMTTGEFKEELAGINDKIELIGEYTAANNKIEVRCETCGREWYAVPTSLRSGTGCARCAGNLKITHDQFVERLNSLQSEMTPLTEYVNTKTNVTVKCNVCGYIWSTQPGHLIAKTGRTGCPKCSNRARITCADFIERVARVSPTIKILGAFASLQEPISVQCGECSRIWRANPTNLMQGMGCKSCKLKTAIRRRVKRVRCITTGEIFDTLKEASEKYHISLSTLCKCCNNHPKFKHAGGKEWEYVGGCKEG